jgi:hypothetical protein
MARPVPPCPFEPGYRIPRTGPPPSPHAAQGKTCLMARTVPPCPFAPGKSIPQTGPLPARSHSCPTPADGGGGGARYEVS